MPALPGVQTSSGCKISIGTTAANMATDTYLVIGEVITIPEFGRVYEEIKFKTLGNRNVRKFKGARDDGSITLQLGRDLNDAGQDAARIAVDSDFDYNFKVELNDKGDGVGATNSLIHFKAKVMAMPINIGGDEQVTMQSLTLGIQSGTIAFTNATAGT